jgi:hypothetical protein
MEKELKKISIWKMARESFPLTSKDEGSQRKSLAIPESFSCWLEIGAPCWAFLPLLVSLLPTTCPLTCQLAKTRACHCSFSALVLKDLQKPLSECS